MDHRITYSQIRTANTCMYKHYLAYDLGIRRTSNPQAIRIGTVFHKYLDYAAQGDAECVTKAMSDYMAIMPRSGTPEFREWDYERMVAYQMIAGYRWRWQSDAHEIRIIASEIPFEIPLINPDTGRKSRKFTLAGKIDKIIEMEFSSGRELLLMEHKTTSDSLAPESDYWRRLRIDRQISIYMIAARTMGYNVNKVLYDVARKPTLTPRVLTQAETKRLIETGEYYAKLPEVDNDVLLGTHVVKYDEENGILTVDGDHALIIDRKRGIAIQETTVLYGERLMWDMARRPEHYYARRIQYRTDEELTRTQREIWAMAQQLQSNNKNGVWIRNDDACIMYGQCPYFDLCANDWNPDMELPDGYIRIDDIHPELKGE
ncbi:MAG TPA: PD-(D/E)XK nuclease family protein [bacterium]|nr:PD-(D/E)XK nuclease family protein [bacterium]